MPFSRTMVQVDLGDTGGSVDLHLVQHGDPRGLPVLFLHGNRSWSITWRRVMLLCGGFRVLAVDLPGFGLSRPLPPGRRTLDVYGATIARLLRDLGIEGAVVVAHEAGGLIAATAGAHSPDLFGGGVLVSSAVLPAPPAVPPTLHRHGRSLRLKDLLFAATGRPRLPLEALQTRRKDFAETSAGLYASPLTIGHRRAMLALARLAAQSDARIEAGEWFVNFPGPLALVWGHRDPLMSPESLAAQERELPYARIWRTEAGHFVQEEEPERIVEAIAWAAGGVGRAADPEPPANFLPGIGTGDFAAVGRDQVRSLVELGGLRPTDAVLDVGCGLGRTARGLRDVLAPEGRYVGIDVVAEVVRWCQQNVTRIDGRFRFRHAPVRNDLYNPHGTVEALGYRFPFTDETFDFVVAGSLFTHLDAPDARHYLREIARVLRPGGTLWASAFLLDDSTREAIAAGRTDRRFATRRGVEWVDHADQPLHAVAFERPWFLASLEHAGLRPTAVTDGSWRGADGELYQDVVVGRR